MFTLRSLVVATIALSFNALSVFAQSPEEGTITIRKTTPENSNKPGLSLGFRVGNSYSVFNHTHDNARNFFSEKMLSLQDLYGYPDYSTQFSGEGSYVGSYFNDFRSIFVGAYVVMPLHHNVEFVPEINYRDIDAMKNVMTATIVHQTTGDEIRYKVSAHYTYSQLEIPLQIRLKFRWKMFEPYFAGGAVPVFNLSSKRQIDVGITAYQSDIDNMEDYGFVTESSTEKGEVKTFHFGLSASGGTKIILSERVRLCLEARYLAMMMSNNVVFSFPGTSTVETHMNNESVTIGLEFNLKK